ncbi:histidine triad nucleotide-binding protein [bacterium DOLZORAL124_64_63]|nr:MAG: histidine triad nucleotide-binding protein [bacterium DOLZORAL124_64_63]
MDDCLFCKISAGNIPCEDVFSDENFLAFRDIDPQAPTHILVIPRRHVSGLAQLQGPDADLADGLLTTAVKIAADLGLAEKGYRFVINQGDEGGQTVGHLHLHILGGRAMAWPPG